MARRDYHNDPLHLWPPGALDNPAFIRADLPRCGVFVAGWPAPFEDDDYLSLDAYFQNHRGTILLAENGSGWEFRQQLFIEEGHPDLETLSWALVVYLENNPRQSIPIRDLIDLCADFLCKRGWVEVCWGGGGVTKRWTRRDEWR